MQKLLILHAACQLCTLRLATCEQTKAMLGVLSKVQGLKGLYNIMIVETQCARYVLLRSCIPLLGD